MEERIGLEEVFRPSSDSEVVVHIVFVHGLFGNRRKTWTGLKNDDKKAEVFWPRLLAAQLPGAYISTWGYDADVDHFLGSASQNTVHQHATSLLSDLQDFREKGLQVPIIFVCHSLGGIIVKDALNQSRLTEGTRLKEILPATYAVMFLGTPHRGSKSASLGKYAYNITLAFTKRPNMKLLQALERNSEVLDRITDDFNQTMLKHELRIHSFREELETRKFLVFNTIVVDADSAKIGHGREEVGSIPANHRKMTKFSGVKDPGYKRVSSQLKRWTDELRSLHTGASSQDYEDFLGSLDQYLNRARIYEVDPAHAKSLEWVFDENVVPFTQWLKAASTRDNPIFWIQGKPGCGKSTLMKFALENIRTRTMLDKAQLGWSRIGFFFHDRGTEEQKSLTSMIQELVYQLVKAHPALFSAVAPLFGQVVHHQKTRKPSWNNDTLKQMFLTIVAQEQYPFRACLFLDALDEHGGDNNNLVELVKALPAACSPQVNIRICIASRPWAIFKTHFSHYPGLEVHLHTHKDIFDYSHTRLKLSLTESEQAKKAPQLDVLAGRVASKALGVFIWVRIVIDELSRGLRDGTPISKLEWLVEKMPEELKDLYARTMNRIEAEYRSEGYAMLNIVLCSRIALSPAQLMAILDGPTINLAEGRLRTLGDDRFSEDNLAMSRRLESRSGGLLEITHRESTEHPSTVQFIHQTVKEFVRSHDEKETTKAYERLVNTVCEDHREIFNALRIDVPFYLKAYEMSAKKPSTHHLWRLASSDGISWLFSRRTETASVPLTYVPLAAWEDCIALHLGRLNPEKRSSANRLGFRQWSIIFMAVCANLTYFIDQLLSDVGPNVYPILQLAVVAPNFVDMFSSYVDRLKSMVELTAKYATGKDPYHGRFDDLAKTDHSAAGYLMGTFICQSDLSANMALAVLLLNNNSFGPQGKDRLGLAEVLLKACDSLIYPHFGHNLSLIEFCALKESADVLRLVLRSYADEVSSHELTTFLHFSTENEVAYKTRLGRLLYLLHFRNDKDVMQALNELGLTKSFNREGLFRFEDVVCSAVASSCSIGLLPASAVRITEPVERRIERQYSESDVQYELENLRKPEKPDGSELERSNTLPAPESSAKDVDRELWRRLTRKRNNNPAAQTYPHNIWSKPIE